MCPRAPRIDGAFEKHSYSLKKNQTSITLDFFEGFQGGFGPCSSPAARGVAAFCRFGRFLCLFSVVAYF